MSRGRLDLFKSRLVNKLLRVFLGPEHHFTLASASNVAAVLIVRHDVSRAERLLREILPVMHRVLGPTHPSTLIATMNLAITLEGRGDSLGAESGLREVVLVQNEILDQEDPHRLLAIHNYARCLHTNGNLAEAESLLVGVLPLMDRVHGPEHAQTLDSKSTLASVLMSRGNLAGSESMFRDVISAQRRVLGPEHPNTLTSMRCLGNVLRSRGELLSAAKMHHEVFDAMRRVLGPDHIETMRSMACVAIAQFFAGDSDKSCQVDRDVLSFMQRNLGSEHPETLAIMNNLAQTLFSRRDFIAAESLQRELVSVSQRLVGPQHPITLTCRFNLSKMLCVRGDLSGAESLQREILHVYTHGLGSHHPQTLVCMQLLAYTLIERGGLLEAEHLLSSALDGMERFRDHARAGVDRAQIAEAIGFDLVTEMLVFVRIYLGRDATSVVDAIERGTSRAILDLVQPMSFEWGKLAAERHARGHWSKQELEHFTDVSRRANELQERLNNPSLPAEAQKQLGEELTELRKELLPLERELLPASSPRSLDQIRAVLRPGELMLLYSWASMAVTLVAIPAPGEGDVTCVILDEDKDRIQQAERAAKTCADGLSGRQRISEMLAAAKDFMSFAFPDSVRAVAARAERLVIIPSGPLHNVSVDVLAEIAEIPEVAEPQMVYAPSASIFAMLRERGQVNGPYDPTIVGDPDLRLAPDKSEPGQQRHTEDDPLGAVLQDTDRWKLKQLPHAGLEARRIAELFALKAKSEVKPLLGPDATVPAVHGHARGKRFLHLATHGQLAGPSDPMGSAIVLSKSKEANEPERFDPAPTTYDKLRLDTLLGWTGHLDGCELVTLSACQTSQGVRTGDSTMALPIGFFHAGARCVLASHWKVADDATGWLMERMYEGLLGLHDEERVVGGRRYPPGQQMPLPDALKEARTWLRHMTLGARNRRVKRAGMLNPAAHRALAQTPATAAEQKTDSAEDPFDGKPADSRPFHDTPYYWAAFVIVGDAGSNGR